MARAGGKDRGLYERRPGEWWIRYHDDVGREHREKAGTKSQARLLYQMRKADALTGRKLPSVRRRVDRSVAEAIAAHLQESRTQNRSWKDDERHARRWSEELSGLDLGEVTPRLLEDWKARRVGEVARKTVNNELSFLRRVFNVAIRDGWDGSNPLSRVRFFRINNQRERRLEPEEEIRLREAMSPLDWTVAELLVLTGLRRGELLGLPREDVDLRRGILRVRSGKGDKQRHVPLSSRAAALLLEHLASHTSRWAFPSRSGDSPMNADNWYHRVWRPALRRAGLRDLRIHDLRHTFCSRLVERGVPLETVARLAGHESLQTTRRYAHLSPDHLSEAVEQLVQPAPKPTP